jgi:hypothetical protein
MKRLFIRWLSALTACLLISCNRAAQAPVVELEEPGAEGASEPAQSIRGPIEPLNDYRGKELAKLEKGESEKLLAIIQGIIRDRKYGPFFDFRPWYVWEFPNNGRPLLVLLEVNNQMPHPGSTGIRINVFDKVKRARAESEFWTGHRCYMHAVSLEKQVGLQDPLVVIETGSFLGPDYHKQVYARMGNRFDLIRLEDSKGKAKRNNYYVNHFACGPTVPRQTSAEWEADILSSDRFRILRSLVWLGGAHWEGKLPDESENQHEPADVIRLVHNIRSNQKVVDQLKTFQTSEDTWVKEAATLAANPKDERW